MRHIEIHIIGSVQGVGLRFGCLRKARSLGVAGFARNETDGSVTIEIEGERVGDFLDWLKSEYAGNIRNLQMDESDMKGYKDFRVE